MSLASYKNAISIMNGNKDKWFFTGSKSKELITLAEERLGIKFWKIYMEFLRRYGAGNFGAQEVYGIIGDDFDNSSVPDVIWYTLTFGRIW